jgi:hypothetical protein
MRRVQIKEEIQMNHAEAVEFIQKLAPDLIVGPQSGNHVDVYKVEGGAPFSISLPDMTHLYKDKDADFIKKAELDTLADALVAAKKVIG